MGILNLDADRVKRHLADPWQVLNALGLLDGAKRQQSGFMIGCPLHSERTPSCSVRVGSDSTLAVHCFGCAFKGDVFHLIAAVHGLDIRREFPRVVEEAGLLCGEYAAAPMQRRRLPPPPRPQHPPPLAEVRRLWADCPPVSDDSDLSRQLIARRIDPRVVADRNLARALPLQRQLPNWARAESRSWRQGYRCILPLYDPAGELVSLHARAIETAPGNSKGLLPAGYSARGLFLADSLALQILTVGIPDWWPRSKPPRLFITEGGIDFLTVACHYGDTEDYPAVLGVIAGSWSDELAQRIPSGCHVAIVTHGDAAGRMYRDRIADSIHARCRVFVDSDQGRAHA